MSGNVSIDEGRLTILSLQEILDLTTVDYGICNLTKLVMINLSVIGAMLRYGIGICNRT